MFVELNELVMDKNQEMQWRETARWIKFEEDVEEETDRWGKPHVASLSFRSLLELRRTISHGERTHSRPCRRMSVITLLQSLGRMFTVSVCKMRRAEIEPDHENRAYGRCRTAGPGPEDASWHCSSGGGTDDHL